MYIFCKNQMKKLRQLKLSVSFCEQSSTTNNCTTDAVSLSVASFNDTRCTVEDKCVYSIDPLFFTCELSDVIALRVVFSNDHNEVFSVGNITPDLPAGIFIMSLIISQIDESTRNISLTLAISNASLLDGGIIICDDTTPHNKLIAGCQVCGKY